MEDFVALWKNMVYPTKPELNGDFCGLTFVNEPVISTVTRANLNTVDGEQ